LQLESGEYFLNEQQKLKKKKEKKKQNQIEATEAKQKEREESFKPPKENKKKKTEEQTKDEEPLIELTHKLKENLKKRKNDGVLTTTTKANAMDFVLQPKQKKKKTG